jgi:hypothetical protein
MELDELDHEDVVESILNAQAISKVLRSRSPLRRHVAEKLYVIKSFSFDGTLIYTKGKIGRESGRQVFYVLVSAKVATFDE